MSMLGVERIMAEVEEKLQADLPAKVAELNALYADGVEIEAPVSYLRMFDPVDQGELNAVAFPAVVIRPEPEDVVDDAAMGTHEYGIAAVVEVAFMTGYDSPSRQQTRLLRYMRACKEILGPTDSLDCGDVAYQGGGFARTWTTDSGVVRDVALLFTVTVYEAP